MKVLLAIINDIEDKGSSYCEKLTNLTDFWVFNATNNTRRFDLLIETIYFDLEDEALEHATNNEFDFVIGNWIGHLLRPFSLEGRHVIRDTIEFCKDNGGLIGHIISHEDKIPYFYKEFWCLDVKKYINYGSPKWALKNNRFTPFVRSETNFHDDYTPHWIKPSTVNKSLGMHINWGCGLIKRWLEAGETIHNVPTSIRELKHHLYPEHRDKMEKYFNSEITVDELDQPLQKQYFSSIDYENSKRAIFLFNTDRIDFDVPHIQIDNLISVCAAFRPYIILHKSGFSDQTTVKFIDYSEVSLKFKKWLVDYWDGRDIFWAVSKFEKQVGSPISWNKDFRKTYEESLNDVIEVFGSKDEWLEFWSKYVKLNHEYHLIDLVSDVDKVRNLLTDKHNYIYFSNSYNTEAGIVKWGKTKLKNSFKQLIEIIKTSNSICDGSDVDHHYPDPNFFELISDDYEY